MSQGNSRRPHVFRIALAGFGLLLAGQGLLAAQTVENPNRPLPEDEYLWWQLPASEQQYDRIDGYRIKTHVEEITAIARRGRDDGLQHWGVIAGQPYHDQVREWIGGHFRRLDLDDVHDKIYDLDPQWVPQSWTATVTAGDQTVELESAHVPYGAVGTPREGLELEPVWLGLGAESDFVGRDVSGKAALVIVQPRPTARGHSGHAGAARAVERGAAAIV